MDHFLPCTLAHLTIHSSFPILWLKPGKDVHLRNRHHAIFRGAVEESPKCEPGSIVEVRSHEGEFLCFAMWNTRAFVSGRAIAFGKGDPLEQLERTIVRAIELRTQMLGAIDSDAIRLVNAEGDAVPGLIVDRYGSVLVIQCATLGMDRLREWVCDVLFRCLSATPKLGARAPSFGKPIEAIYEKSSGSARKNEGLEPREGWLRGISDERFTVSERGIIFAIDLRQGQKTGLFLDQREMRSLVRVLAKDRTVLDVCSYVGGFSLAALLGGARSADAVDYDGAALERAQMNAKAQGIGADRFCTYVSDAFDFLRKKPLPRPYDFIILDPPAFAKRSSDLEPAKKAYTDLNRLAMETLPAGGLLLTCSCSYQIDPPLFQQIVFHAARQAKRGVRILGKHRHALDHPVNLFHPESDYLKSLLLSIE